jgi:hypothetical protein
MRIIKVEININMRSIFSLNQIKSLVLKSGSFHIKMYENHIFWA